MADKKQKQNPESKPGPEPETLKIEGDWKQAMKKAMKKKKPKDGWPKGRGGGQESRS